MIDIRTQWAATTAERCWQLAAQFRGLAKVSSNGRLSTRMLAAAADLEKRADELTIGDNAGWSEQGARA